ncbi:MAG: hypothetical protein PW788_00270 [Micavibrio sp.]|nr:hypothetical protein [Micavibrio sp.]
MFDFKKAILGPALDAIKTTLHLTAKTPDATDKAEKLLTLRDEADAKLTSIAQNESDKGMVGMAAIGIGMLGVLVGAAGVIAAPLLPLLAGAALIVAGGATTAHYLSRESDVNEARDALDAKIKQQLVTLAASNQVNTEKSPRFAKALKDSFKSAAQEQRNIEAAARSYTYMAGAACIR